MNIHSYNLAKMQYLITHYAWHLEGIGWSWMDDVFGNL
jgi:hypothetical protein